MTTIQELKAFGQQAGGGDQKNFDGLVATVTKAEPPKQGQYGQMQRVQLQDGTGSWYFSAMDCPPLHQGEQVIASGRVKGNQGKAAYFNLTSIESAHQAGQPPAYQQQPPPPAQTQQAAAQQAPPAAQSWQQPPPKAPWQRCMLVQAVFTRLALDLRQALTGEHLGFTENEAKATLLEPAVVAQLLVTANSTAMGWEMGKIAWEPPQQGQPYYQDDQAEDDGSIPFAFWACLLLPALYALGGVVA